MLLQGAGQALGTLPGIPGALNFWMTAAGVLLRIWCFCTLFAGLDRLCPAENTVPGIRLCGFLYIITGFIAWVGGSLGWLAAVPSFFIFLYILVQVRKVRNACWLRGVHAGARRLGRRGLWAVALCALVIAGAPVLTSYLVAAETPAAVFSPPADAAAEAARQKLVALGMDADVAADLPAEELQLLAGAVYVGMSYHYMTIDGGDFVAQHAVCVLDERKRESRVISRLLWETPPDHAWRDGVGARSAYCLWNEDMPLRMYSLWEKDGVTLEMPVLRQEEQEENGFFPPGFEYRVLPEAERQRVICCASWYMDGAESGRSLWSSDYSYIHRTRFFCSPYVSAASPDTGAFSSHTAGFISADSLPAGFTRYRIQTELPPETAR
jgi:hypothetical protein